MEDPLFKLHGIHVLNIILDWLYISLLFMCFILALRDRPLGYKWGYTVAFIGFSLIVIYMTVGFVFS
jgi:chitin synthase